MAAGWPSDQYEAMEAQDLADRFIESLRGFKGAWFTIDELMIAAMCCRSYAQERIRALRKQGYGFEGPARCYKLIRRARKPR